MNKFKKPINFNFFSLLIAALPLVVLAVFASISLKNNSLQDILIFDFFNDLAVGFYVHYPLIIAFLILVFALSARLVYSKTSKRLMAYRIIMGIGYAVTLTLSIIYSSLFWYGKGISFVIAVIFDIYVIGVSIAGIINTYSKRILK